MSIFKDTFKEGVRNQIKARQEAINERTPTAIQYFNARNSWIRMTSSVNVGNDAGALAKSYILLGGTLYDNKARTGVGTGNQAYSTLSPGGTTNMLGIRPMPGITGINVKSLGAYGSLREVTVNFQCWDIRQLEELELLYMRPGYSVFVEWGWAPYLNNNKGLEGNISFIDDVLNGSENSPTKETIWKNIFDKSSKDGNYEGHYGFVKNYSWSARPDGGYDCTTNIISMGEILESLKVNYGKYDTNTSTKGSYNVLPPSKFAKDTTIFKAYNQNVIAGIVAELYEIAKSKTTNPVPGSTSIYPEVEFNGYKFFRFNVSVNGKDAKDTITTNGAQIYIPLKDFISVLNDKVILKDSNKPLVELSVYCGNHNGGETIPLTCVGDELQISTDPSVCLIKNLHWENPVNLGLEDVLNSNDFSTTKNIMKTLTQNYWYKDDYKTQQLGIIGNIYINLDFIYSLVTDPNLASQDKKEKNDIALFDLIKNIMSRVSTSLGSVSTFELFVDPVDNKARIIDINYTGNRKDDWDNATIIEIQNTKSIVRSYKLESQIFQDQSTIIAIGAQAQGGALGADTNTLIDFNQNLIDRIIPKKDVNVFNNSNLESETEKQKQKIQNLKDSLGSIIEYIIKIDPSWYESKGDFDATESSKYSNALKDVINYFKSIVKTDNKNRALIPTKLSIDMDGIGGMVIGNLFRIPEEFLPRGYKGTGPGSPGPQKIAYAVTGLAHSVQNNDWTTTIESQFIILDEPRGILTPADARNIRATIKAVTSTNDVSNLVNSTQAVSGGTTKIICGQVRTNGNIEDLLVEIKPDLYRRHYSSINQSDNKRIRLQPEAMKNLEALLTDSYNAGIYIKVNSAFRTYDDQVRIKNNAGNIPCATPGNSNHGFGLSVDLANSSGGRINPITTPKEWKWIQENKSKYYFDNNIKNNTTTESHHYNFTQVGKIC